MGFAQTRYPDFTPLPPESKQGPSTSGNAGRKIAIAEIGDGQGLPLVAGYTTLDRLDIGVNRDDDDEAAHHLLEERINAERHEAVADQGDHQHANATPLKYESRCISSHKSRRDGSIIGKFAADAEQQSKNLCTFDPLLKCNGKGKAMPTISAVAYAIQYSGPVDEIAAALAFHDGDARATIGTLPADTRF